MQHEAWNQWRGGVAGGKAQEGAVKRGAMRARRAKLGVCFGVWRGVAGLMREEAAGLRRGLARVAGDEAEAAIAGRGLLRGRGGGCKMFALRGLV